MSRHALLLLLLVLAASLFGCDSTPPVNLDGGPIDAPMPMFDTGPRPDAPVVTEGVCDDVRAITLVLGEQSITGDTTGRGNDEVLGENCGDPDGARAPQEAISMTIPGTSQVGVRFTFENAGTSTMFDTIFELRRDGCDSLATAEGCQMWDDIDYPAETRSQGEFLAMGGDTVYGIVSGYATANAGPWQMDVEVVAVNAPTETAASVVRVDMTRLDIDVTGGDVDGDATGVRVSFLDDMGAVIAIEGETEFDFGFLEPVDGMTTFSARARVAAIGDFPDLVTAAEARVAIIDVYGLASASMMVPITDAMESGLGETCATGFVCSDAFTCTAMTCALPAATTAACTGATPITLAPGAATTTTTVMGSVPAMEGVVLGSCMPAVATTGAEVLYTIVIPAAVAPAIGYDLVATTDTDATGDGDTVLYVQSTCGDPSSDMGRCNDDIDPDAMNFASMIDSSMGIGAEMGLAAGTYTIGVESYGVAMAAVPFGMDVSLRPVLPMGQACDPMGVMNRCSTGDCPASGTAICP